MIEPLQPPLLDGFADDVPPAARQRPRRTRRRLASPIPKGGEPGEGNSSPGKKHPKNRLNELCGDEWIFFTKSVVTTAYPSDYGHTLRKAHGANKPPQLMQALIEFFTAAG